MVLCCEDFVFLKCVSLGPAMQLGRTENCSADHFPYIDLLNILQESLRISERTATTKSTGSLRLEIGGKIKESSSRLQFFFASKSQEKGVEDKETDLEKHSSVS